MNSREEFLVAVFRALDQRGIEYCVARNADTVFVDGPSDVDFLARPADIAAVREVCEDAASTSGFALVQAARFVNHSWIFAHERGVLVRIDVDTEIRWRSCHVLSADEVLRARQRCELFYIPSPKHEAAILRAQIAWRGSAPERYTRRLGALGEPPVSAAQARRSIALRAIFHPLAALHYSASDTARVFARCFEALTAKRTAASGASIALAGLDGAGKTTFARALLIDVAQSRRYAGTRYFHWIPSPFRRAEFPWPASGNKPHRAPEETNIITAAASVIRLARSIVLAWLGFALVVRPLVRRGWLVIIDRYATNYWLDPASVRYSGASRWLSWAQRLFPSTDFLVALSADASTLRSRKDELSDTQIAEQSERLQRLPKLTETRIDLDAAQPVDTLVAQVLAALPKP